MRARLNSYLAYSAGCAAVWGPLSSSSRSAGRISAQSADARAAQRPGVLASLPPGGIISLMYFNVIVPTLGLAGAQLIVDANGFPQGTRDATVQIYRVPSRNLLDGGHQDRRAPDERGEGVTDEHHDDSER